MIELFNILVLIAIIGIPIGKCFQVYHVYKHKEVRDISAFDLGMMLYSYVILTVEAFNIGSDAFFYKNVAIFFPVAVLSYFKWIYRDKEWHDDDDGSCFECDNEIEPHWTYCPDCGTACSETDGWK